jgi:acetate kinase
MNRQVITLNAGSSSIKFALFELDGGVPAARAVGLVEMLGKLRRITVRDGAGAPIYEDAWPDAAGAPFHIEALRRVLEWRLGAFPDANVVAAGHRVPALPVLAFEAERGNSPLGCSALCESDARPGMIRRLAAA